MKELLEAASKSLWKELRDLALKKGTETLVSEGLKSFIEIAKRRRIRMDEHEFAEWKKEQSKGDEKDDSAKSKKTDNAKSKDSDEAPLEESPVEESGEAEAKKPAPKEPAPDDPAPPDDDA